MKKIFSYILLPAFLAAAGCNKFPENINVNPNLPTNPTNAQLLTSAINQLPVTLEAPTPILYAQHWSEKPFPDNSRYLTVNFDFYGLYAGPLENLQTILNTKTFNVNDGSQANQLAVARILKAFFFWHATDRWGDIPYSQALKGKDNFTPKYDAQKDIYYDLMKELKEAAAQIDNGNAVKGDILYNGNMANWKRFANSIRMLMALRLSKIDPTKGQAEFVDANAGGVFTDNSQSAVFVHLNDANNQNYWYYVTNPKGQNRPWYWASKTIVDNMNPLKDPRLKIFADTTSTGTYNGVPYGVDANTAAAIPSASVSFIGVHTRTQNAPCYITTYPQVLFALAEAAKIGWINGGDVEAAAKYNAGIENSVRQWVRISFQAYNDKTDNQVEKVVYSATDKGDTTGLGAYMARPEVAYNATNALSQIGTQRWLHLYANGYEAWAEWRRTGFPALTPAPNNGGTPIPRRQAYPLKEQNINGANYAAAIAQQPALGGADDLKGRVWWDKP
ncbi:SusD/RagB family nutrient-binding outer membrane lipoprotein [Sediminibacterium ginsengisoli]|uniref:Starch-binding associating with outer membrane n=1 Tax=Sediminibacterium ginsengisoli TaxID=413434 RepID=A0A1T4MMW8_9BACT|nr:SusD/RagB family nutrient-binding outer membrane lipoprotein [Sediminibacterium ginsengisoli]SJZ68450.1 Starch-binding associating with outer membrane [Sediminibacterium ginsengisoli]